MLCIVGEQQRCVKTTTGEYGCGIARNLLPISPMSLTFEKWSERTLRPHNPSTNHREAEAQLPLPMKERYSVSEDTLAITSQPTTTRSKWALDARCHLLSKRSYRSYRRERIWQLQNSSNSWILLTHEIYFCKKSILFDLSPCRHAGDSLRSSAVFLSFPIVGHSIFSNIKQAQLLRLSRRHGS